ncbi:MAG: bifunctional UDP-sugar hydrolase/5'-nucleotidase [Spirochaetia bacterium]|nr:bifunctional UDP-sugar hydrolase/5'-nucleotidase [Spirochaetia bacterium]
MKAKSVFLVIMGVLIALSSCTSTPVQEQAPAPVVTQAPAPAPVAAPATVAAPVAEKYIDQPFVLTIIETSDTHGAFFPYDFKTNKPKATNLAQAATIIKQERAKPGAQVLLLDGGDNLQGQPIIYYYNFVADKEPSVFSQMMNELKYDAIGVGNHDVETGHAVYDKVRRELDAGLLSANLVDEKTKAPYFTPYKIIMKGGLKIAVLGLTTPGFRKNFPTILYSGIEIQDMLETAQKWVPIIQEKEKPDLLIGLFHSGVDYTYAKGENYDTPLNENAAQIIAQEVPGLDLVFVGHDHQGWEGQGYDPSTKTRVDIKNPDGDIIPIFGALDDCRKIVVATVSMRWNKDTETWSKETSGKLVSTDGVPPDESFMKKFDPQFQAAKAWVSRPIGKVDGVMKGQDSLYGDSSFVDMVHLLQLELTKDPANKLKPAQISFCAPLDVNAVVPSSPDGTVYVRDMFSLYRYENWLYTMDLTGKQIQGFMEISYGDWFNTMEGPEDNLIAFKTGADGRIVFDTRSNLPATKVATYNYDSVAGIKYTVDVSKPAGSRIAIQSMSDGSPFSLDETYSVAINSYRAMGGGGILEKGAGIPAPDLLSMKYVTSATTRDLRIYLTQWFEKQKGAIPAASDSNWKIIPENWAAAGKARDFALMFPARK